MTINEIIARWKSGEGRPFRGWLIDLEAYNRDPDNIGCMCAQGQVLHLLGGVDPQQLAAMDHYESDRTTARILGISRAHAALLRIVNDQGDGCPEAVLENPALVLGDQWRAVLAFWRHLDRMTLKQWRAVSDAVWNMAGASAWNAACAVARDSAGSAAGAAARDSAGSAAGAAARALSWNSARAATGAANEIQGSAVMRRRGQPFYFLPLFGFSDPESVLASEEAGQFYVLPGFRFTDTE